MTEDEVRHLLREMGEEPVPADSLRRVRLRVAERTARRPVLWWRTAAALAAAACVILLIVWWPKPAPVIAPPRRTVAPPQVAAVPEPVRPKPRPPVRVAVKRAPPRPVETKAADIVIRIETEDPNVVILLSED